MCHPQIKHTKWVIQTTSFHSNTGAMILGNVSPLRVSKKTPKISSYSLNSGHWVNCAGFPRSLQPSVWVSPRSRCLAEETVGNQGLHQDWTKGCKWREGNVDGRIIEYKEKRKQERNVKDQQKGWVKDVPKLKQQKFETVTTSCVLQIFN